MTKNNQIIKPLIIIIALCLVDGLLTIHWLNIGIAIELNPIMDSLIQKSTILFLLLKTGITILSGYILYIYRKIPGVVKIAKLLSFLYIILIIYHVSGYLYELV